MHSKEELRGMQGRAHEWGEKNRVTFDASKEGFHILHPLFDDESQFKLLGTLIDSALTMKPLVDGLLAKLRPQVRAILKLRHIYPLATLMQQFKTHIWSHLEHHAGAIIMAKKRDRERIDKMQRGFLYELGSNDTDAFLTWGLGPPSFRRAVGILGFIHKRTFGLCHPSLMDQLPTASYATI